MMIILIKQALRPEFPEIYLFDNSGCGTGYRVQRQIQGGS